MKVGNTDIRHRPSCASLFITATLTLGRDNNNTDDIAGGANWPLT